MKTRALVATLTLALAATAGAGQTAFATHDDPLGNVFLEAVPAVQSLYSDEVGISARSASAIDVQTGRMLYEKRGDDRMLIASTTKIITTIVAIESGVSLDSVVTVSSRAAGKEGSSIYLKAGEKQTLRDLLYAVMLRSGNDAATAVAEHVGGGSEAKFVEKMNQLVEQLGLTGSHFANPTGLDGKEHYSTAHDMAILSAYALLNPIFAEISKTQVKTIPNPNESWDRKLYNKNKMLTRYDGADGGKTGYTKAAGRCLVSSATRDGRQIAVVTLDASSDWVDHARLLDYGFQKYGKAPVAKEHDVVQQVAVEDGLKKQVGVMVGEQFDYPVRDEEKDKLRTEITVDDSLHAPVFAGQEIGEMKVYFEDKMVGQVPLLAADDVGEQSIWNKLTNLFKGVIGQL
jgi:serine-type D-Ala-D-Ala carboxypeptidase (penicillin-binding protein 5/6)